MNPDIQQLNKRIEELEQKIAKFYRSSDIDRNVETAFRERLNMPQIFTGIVVPAITPIHLGDIYINTVLTKVYVATGLSSSSDWKILN